MNLNYIIFSVLFVCACSPKLCNQSLEINKALNEISDSDYILTHNYGNEIILNDSFNIKIITEGKKVNCALLNKIEKQDEIIISHILLSRINIDDSQLFPVVNYTDSSDTLEIEYNGNKWMQINNHKYESITPLEEILNYWSSIVKQWVDNKYSYNGKELVDDLDINLHDYGARYYDPAIARFTTVDPAADEYGAISPFAYVANNPLIFIDPTGAYIEPASDEAKKLYDQIYNSASDDIKKIYDDLHSSDVVYRIAFQELDGLTGTIEFGSNQDKEGQLVIDLLIDPEVSPDEQTTALGDELEHARQFEEGFIGFIETDDGRSSPGSSYDMMDEYVSQLQGLRALEDVKGSIKADYTGGSSAIFKAYLKTVGGMQYVREEYGGLPRTPMAGSEVSKYNNIKGIKTTVYRSNGKTVRHDN